MNLIKFIKSIPVEQLEQFSFECLLASLLLLFIFGGALTR